MFSLVGRLPSMPSASGLPLLFAHFVGTSRPSDFPSTCMLDFWITSFSNRPVHNCVSGVDGTSRFSRVKFPRMPGVFDRAEPDGCSHFAFAGVAFRILEQRRHSDFRPLSRLNTLPACSPVNASRAALRLPAHDSGQVGSLRLTCTTLAFATSRRFIPAHSNWGPKLGFFGGFSGVSLK